MVLHAARAAVDALLSNAETLYDAARRFPDALPVAGRTTAYAISLNSERWLVRHYVRGGVVAPILGDRYARVISRSFRELELTAAAAERGVPTPTVIAAAEYTAGLFFRFDIVFHYISDAHDLAAVLFDNPGAAQPAARAIRAALAGGLVHADLNLKNILVRGDQGWIIDLDRARLEPRINRSSVVAMRERFLRSLEKWQRRIGRDIDPAARKELEQAFDA